MPGYGQAWQIVQQLSVPLVMVIDPGHGGMDGGPQQETELRKGY